MVPAKMPGGKVRFSVLDDISCLKEVISENPFLNTRKWEVIARNLALSSGKLFTRRSVKDRVMHILRLFKTDDFVNLRRSGTDEQYDEREQLLQSIVTLLKEFAPFGKLTCGASSHATGIASRNSALKSMPEIDEEPEVEETSDVLSFNCQMEERNTSSSPDSSNSGVQETAQSVCKSKANKRTRNMNVAVEYLKRKLESDFKLRAEELQQSSKRLFLEEKKIALEQDKIALETNKFTLEAEERRARLKMEEEEHRQKIQLEMEEKRLQIANSQLQNEMLRLIFEKFQQ